MDVPDLFHDLARRQRNDKRRDRSNMDKNDDDDTHQLAAVGRLAGLKVMWTFHALSLTRQDKPGALRAGLTNLGSRQTSSQPGTIGWRSLVFVKAIVIALGKRKRKLGKRGRSRVGDLG